MPTARERRHRARFAAVKRRVFEDMGRASARWRLSWILPFHAFVVALLALHGEPTGRVALQVAAVGTLALVAVARALSSHPVVTAVHFFVGASSYLLLLGTTGGLASPLLVSGGVIFAAVLLTHTDYRWMRPVFLTTYLGGFLVLALLSRTSLGALPAPLAPHSAWPTADFVVIALAATGFTVVGMHRICCAVTRGYELASLELAERREEICTESEDRTRAIEGMAARLAHEVKNPLAAIKGLSKHMARAASDPKTAERLAIVAAEADRLQEIVDGFLSFSRGLDDLKLGPVHPHAVARELGVLLETRAEEAGVGIDVSGDAELAVDADERKLRQALLNLVLNAVQASPLGARVRIAVERDCDGLDGTSPAFPGRGRNLGVRITVRDDGVGMTPEVLSRIARPYFTTKEGGSGLGVAVARGLIEQHGGQLEFKSTAGKGTTAIILLPMKAKASEALPNPLRPEGAAVAGAR
jgi:signal transduction histidine kinase